MSRVERKEYHETKIMRSRSPVRGRGSTQNLAEFDNNLDHLLQDLQNSVGRPDSALGSNTSTSYKEIRSERSGDSSARTNSLNRVTNLKASNPITEYSNDDSYSYTSPDGTKSVKTVKKEVYSYKTSGSDLTNGNRMQTNINQLDSLLDDLQQVKQSSETYRSGVTPGYQEYSKSKVTSGKTVVERDVVYPETPKTSRSRTLDRSDRENSVTRELQLSANEGTYGDLKSLRTASPSPSRTSTLSKQTKVTNVHSYPMEVIETSTPDINPEILASLDPNLLPAGNTKVTTTIKTYTYEIPGTVYPTPGSVSETEKLVYSPNQSQTTPSKSFVYNKFENNSLSRNTNYQNDPNWQNTVYRETTTTNMNDQPYQRPPPPVGSDTTILNETVTTRNYQPGNMYRDHSGKHTYMYDESTTTRSVDGYPPHREPPTKETVIINETHTTNTGPPYRGYPPQETIIYKENNTTNNISNRPYPRDEGDIRYPKPPPEPVNITYKYSSTSSTSNNFKGYPPGSETEPLLQPRPFPITEHDGTPPKKVDELMATIGREPPNSPLNAGFNAHEVEAMHQRKVDTLRQNQVEQDEKKKEEIQRTKNITGPPVYYPPGYEMFAKKEEGGWKAEGAMAKESGKYKYEAESKSKSSSKSGAAIVPVCLPLCCGLPCTIL